MSPRVLVGILLGLLLLRAAYHWVAGADGANRVQPAVVRHEASGPPSQTSPGDRPVPSPAEPTEIKLPTYDIKASARDLAKLEGNPYGNDTIPATFTANGEQFDGVKLRYRGAWSRGWSKKSLKLFFDDQKPFEGHHALNLNSGERDPALVREILAYHIYAACGVPASQSRLVAVRINGQPQGLYVEVEQPDKVLLKRHNLKGATIFKANQGDERDLGRVQTYERAYEIQTQKKQEGGFGELQQFCHELATNRNVAEFFTNRVDLDRYVNYLAATALTQNWDSYNKNHCLVYDGKGSKKWFPLPWDLDRTLGDHWNNSFSEARLPVLLGTRSQPGVTGWNRLAERFFSDPALRLRFANRLEELLKTEFTPEKLFPVLDRLEATIGLASAQDRPSYARGIQTIKGYIGERRAFLLKELPALRR